VSTAGEASMRLLLLLEKSSPLWFTGPSLCQEPKADLETAFREWDKGLSSANNEEQVKAMRAMLPNKDDIAYLFPKHVDKLWSNFEKGNRFLEKNVEKIAMEFTRGSEIKKVKTIDVRKDKNRAS